MTGKMSVLAGLLIVAGCSGAVAPPPPPSDAGEQPPVDAGVEPDAGAVPDAGTEPDAGAPDAGPPDAGRTPPQLAWRKVAEDPPSRSNHVSFYWPPLKRVLMFSGNHVTGPIHDAWSWDGTAWQPRPLGATEYPERKNAGLAVDSAGGQVFVFGGTWSGYPVAGGPHVVRVLGDTQRWDGTGWTELQPAAAPSPRGGAAMTWDSARGQAVLFGGSDNVSTFDDTWTFDGTTWTQRTLTTHPSGRINARMAYDPLRQRVVLFSGQAIAPTGAAVNLADTWEWDGTEWRDVTALSAQPEGRGHHTLAWDPRRNKVMLMGGARHFAPLPPGSAIGDQWEWDGATWSAVTPAGPRPPPRTATSLAFDAERSVMVLYGGFDDYDLSDLWEWDGQAWTERTTQPVPRSDFAFAQAKPGGDALLFGGYMAGGGLYLSDSWRFTQGTWRRVGGAAPPSRSTASLAFHGNDALLFGGAGKQGTATVLRADAWLLKEGESAWRPVTGTLPPARRAAAMGYDPDRRITVLFGGRTASAALGDTWVWNGTEWAQLMPPVSPSARYTAKLIFDPVRKQLVLLGGILQDRTVPNDSWAFDGETWQLLDGLTAAPTPRAYNAVAFDSYGRLLSWGGLRGSAVAGDLGVRDGATWSEVPAGPSPRFDASWIDLGDRWRTVFGSDSDFSTRWKDHADIWELAP